MSEQRGSPDDQFINVDDGDELRHWSKLLQTTPEEIKAAVCAVGTSAMKVRAHLKLHRAPVDARAQGSVRGR